MLLLDFISTFIFALTGARVLLLKDCRFYAVALAAVCTAVGGGTVRDLFIADDAIFWMENWLYPSVALLAVPLAYRCSVVGRNVVSAIRILDSVGVAVFLVIGVNVAMAAGCSLATVILASVLTGIGGGVIRDIVCQRRLVVPGKGILFIATASNALLATLLIGSGISEFVVISICALWQVIVMEGLPDGPFGLPVSRDNNND